MSNIHFQPRQTQNSQRARFVDTTLSLTQPIARPSTYGVLPSTPSIFEGSYPQFPTETPIHAPILSQPPLPMGSTIGLTPPMANTTLSSPQTSQMTQLSAFRQWKNQPPPTRFCCPLSKNLPTRNSLRTFLHNPALSTSSTKFQTASAKRLSHPPLRNCLHVPNHEPLIPLMVLTPRSWILLFCNDLFTSPSAPPTFRMNLQKFPSYYPTSKAHPLIGSRPTSSTVLQLGSTARSSSSKNSAAYSVSKTPLPTQPLPLKTSITAIPGK